MTLHVELVSPEAVGWSGDADGVLCRILGAGDIQFRTGHAPFLGALDVHPVIMYLADGTEEVIAVRGGFVSVSDDRVKILSDQSDRPEHIDPVAARAARTAAEETLKRVEDDEAAESEHRWQTARLRAVGED